MPHPSRSEGWARLIMRLMRSARNLARRALLVLLAALGTMAGRAQELATPVLDLTKPVPREQQIKAVPGISVGGVGGRPLPSGYPLPLSVRLQSVSPQPVESGKKFTVELFLRNTGGSAFLLPASQNAVAVFKEGNKRRRSLVFSLLFVDPRSGQQTSSVMAVAVASATVPDSTLRIEPGQQIRVLFTGDLGPVADWLRTDGLTTLHMRAKVSEWLSEDLRYFVKSESTPVVSDNAITVGLVQH